MADRTLPSSQDGTSPTCSDTSNAVKTEEGRQDTPVSGPPVTAPAPLQPGPKSPESTEGLSLATREHRQTKPKNDVDASTVASLEHAIISSELEAQFGGLFIKTPPISPKTTPLPYPQRPKDPTAPFPARKYTLRRVEDVDGAASTDPTDEIAEVTDDLDGFSLEELEEVRRQEMQIALDKMRELLRRSGRLYRPHRFPGIDMNFGQRRPRYTLIEYFEDSQFTDFGGPAERKRTAENNMRFSFRAHIIPMELDEVEFGGMFERIFVGTGIVGLPPGSWSPTGKDVFQEWRGKTFLKQVMIKLLDIGDKVVEWKKNQPEVKTNNLKREVPHNPFTKGFGPDTKRVKMHKRTSTIVLSDEWRSRRRMQEKKAGRWTDGTLRMDRMWSEFYWVLDEDDPLKAVWGEDQKRPVARRRGKLTL